jgi:hypothetical protein
MECFGIWVQMMDSEQDNITLGEMIAVEDGLYAKGFGVAADLVSHYLDNTGTPMQINAGAADARRAGI